MEHFDYITQPKHDICSYDGHEVMEVLQMLMCILHDEVYEIGHIMLYGEHMKISMYISYQVHDELNFSVYPEEKDIVKNIVIEEMQNALTMKVPLVADSGFGKNWLEAH